MSDQQPYDGLTAYERFIENEGVPVLTGFSVADIHQVEVSPWPRKDGLGMYVQLEGTGGLDDAYICEIPAGKKLKPQRHLYEELVFVASGRGATTLWNEKGVKINFEWKKGSLFSIPLNVSYQHFNGSGMEPARLFSVTNAPLMINLIHNLDFIFDCPFDFTDRFDNAADFTGKGVSLPGRVWETNFVADVYTHELQEFKHRGGTNVMFEIANNSMAAHISEFPVGTYKKAHRHGPGAHVIILSGQGYTLLWQEGGPMTKVDWRPGSVVVPPGRWFHQHFNTGAEPARYMALRWHSQKYPVFIDYIDERPTTQGGDQIEYNDEDPKVKEIFVEELKKNGVEYKMSR